MTIFSPNTARVRLTSSVGRVGDLTESDPDCCHGSYATGAASVSPIGDQLQELHSGSETLEEFIKAVGTFDRVEDLADYLSKPTR